MESLIESLKPLAELGFAGAFFAVLALVMWIIKQFVGVMKDHTTSQTELTTALGSNTAATTQLSTEVKELRVEGKEGRELMRSVHDKLLQRPCMISDE